MRLDSKHLLQLIAPPNDVLEILCALEARGFQALIVGGAIRDRLLGLEVSDWDLSTSATPDEIMRTLAHYKLDKKAQKYGIIGVRIGEQTYEIATFRQETYKLNRHPDSITFVQDFNQDALRRDFRMNALGFSPSLGLIDPLGGYFDIAQGEINTVIDAKTSFANDNVRAIRALRFASILNFSLSKSIQDTLKSEVLIGIPKVHLRAELEKILYAKYVEPVLREFAPLFYKSFADKNTSFERWQADYLHNLTLLSKCQNIYARFALATRFMPKILELASFSKQELKLIQKHARLFDTKLVSRTSILRALGEFDVALLVENKEILESLGADFAQIVSLTKNAIYKTSQLAISAQDIKELCKDSTQYKFIYKILKDLLNAHMHGEIENERAKLLIKARDLLKKM